MIRQRQSHADLTAPHPAVQVRPTVPIREFVVKVHQRCNLACDYCYIYQLGDQTWRSMPMLMSDEVIEIAARRIAVHVSAHRLQSIRVIFHGGEPLLAGVEKLAIMAGVISAALPAVCAPSYVVQTNGTLLNEEKLERLREHRIGVGVSWDGGRSQDQHRRYPDGRGSSGAVDRALALLGSVAFRDVFAGLLCTIDVSSDPVECFEELIAHRPPAVDLLLPHATWSRPAPRAVEGPVYGEWLIRAFDRWYDADPMETRVRLFEAIIAGHLGMASRSEQAGLSPLAAVVIESDGSIELVDSMRAAYPGASGTGLHLLTHDFDAFLRHPVMVARQSGFDGLCRECRRCRHGRVCGGGHYVHRYREGSGFQNPSVYCADMAALSEHVGARIRSDLARLPSRPQI